MVMKINLVLLEIDHKFIRESIERLDEAELVDLFKPEPVQPVD
jgi:hypothetical protein